LMAKKQNLMLLSFKYGRLLYWRKTHRFLI
jgi:hypothetical protein